VSEATRRVIAAPLQAAPWAPFGWIPVDDVDPTDGAKRLSYDGGDPHLNVIAHDLAEIEALDGAVRCTELFRHARHTQALLVLNCNAVIAVAPAGTTFSGPDDARHVQAFVLRPLDYFVLERGTWHWGPFPYDAPSVRLWNLQALGYIEDNDRADLAACGATVDVVVS
jgi:ureidoglycolate hydrolase